MSHSTDRAELSANIRLRPMHEPDLPDVHRLEVVSQPVPWPLWFLRRQVRTDASCWVLEDREEIIGFGILGLTKRRAHIMNVCVAPSYRRLGLGHRIMLHLLETARKHHCQRVWLEVCRTNRSAIRLYRKLGFRKYRTLKGYCPRRMGRQNGLLMARPLRK